MAKAILIFGGAELQQSLITECNHLGLTTVVIDPDANALCKNIATHFEVVGGNDFEGTCAMVEKYHVQAVITAATDKPLAMMAKVAAKYNFPFYSEETAKISTDKLLMKEVFIQNKIPCAYGIIASELPTDLNYPVIIKPRDNSGSRGVIFCKDEAIAKSAMQEAMGYTKKESVLIEEVIDGKEYSIESIHYRGQNKVIQITEKITTPFPYNVELGHVQPAGLSREIANQIEQLIDQIANALGFNACASHTELKINDKGIFIIETSPRLGGDFITSKLVPLSTGINIEQLLINIALNEELSIQKSNEQSAAIYYFDFKERVVPSADFMNSIFQDNSICLHKLTLNNGSTTPKITNSINRYGYIIFSKNDRTETLAYIDNLNNIIEKYYSSNLSNHPISIDILDSNHPKWDTILEQLNINHQIHFTASYHQLMEKNGDGKATAIYIKENESEFFYPFMLNKFEQIGDYQLPIKHSYIKSVYGYTGPIIKNANDRFTNQVLIHLQDFFHKENVLFEFVRFNSFLNNQENYQTNFGIEVHEEKDYIYVDLALSYKEIHAHYSKSFKNNINKAKRLQLACSTLVSDEIWEQFCSLYTIHMKNKLADEYYYFGDIYFKELRKLLAKNGELFYIQINEKIIASTLFLHLGNCIYSHHSTRDLENPLSGYANKLIHDTAIQYYQERNFSKMMLGGGISSLKNDTLLKFKESISKDRLSFCLGKKIIDKENYNKYVAIWQKTYPEISKLYEKHIEKITKTANKL